MVRQGRVLVRVEVRGCDATSAMEVQMMHPMGREVADGCAALNAGVGAHRCTT